VRRQQPRVAHRFDEHHRVSTVIPKGDLVEPASGADAGGTVVTITGEHFTSAATVKIGGAYATGVTYTDETTILATTPRVRPRSRHRRHRRIPVGTRWRGVHVLRPSTYMTL
jgi:hypothetical protein